MSHNWPYRGLLALAFSIASSLALAQQGVPIGPIGVSNSVGPGGGFPITIGSTSIAAGSTTTTVTGLNLVSPTVGGGGSSTQQIVFTPNSGNTGGIGMANGGSVVLLFSNASAGFGFDAANFYQRSDGSVKWGNSTNVTSTMDTNLSRDSAGVIDFGTGSQGSTAGSAKMTNLTASGVITFAGVTTGTNADFACFAAGGVMTLQTSACTISSLRFKHLLGDYRADAAATLSRFKPIVFRANQEKPNPDWNADKAQIGLSAENVAAIEPRCAIYEQDGKTPKSYRQECVIALLVAAVNEQRREIDALKRRRYAGR